MSGSVALLAECLDPLVPRTSPYTVVGRDEQVTDGGLRTASIDCDVEGEASLR